MFTGKYQRGAIDNKFGIHIHRILWLVTLKFSYNVMQANTPVIIQALSQHQQRRWCAEWHPCVVEPQLFLSATGLMQIHRTCCSRLGVRR